MLDAGCGEGYFSRALAARGARVVGADYSEALIASARKKSVGLPITYDVRDLRRPLPYESGSFNIVIANLSLMDFDPIDRFMEESARLLAPDGRMVFSILHPLFTGSTISHPISRKLFRRPIRRLLLRYRTQARTLFRIRGVHMKTALYHRPLEAYAACLFARGFSIIAVREPTFPNERVTGRDFFLQSCAEFPPFLVVAAERIERR